MKYAIVALKILMSSALGGIFCAALPLFIAIPLCVVTAIGFGVWAAMGLES